MSVNQIACFLKILLISVLNFTTFILLALGLIYYSFLSLSKCSVQFSSVASRVQLFVTRRTTAHQSCLSITNSQSSPKLMSIESVMPSNHLILCHTLLLPSFFPSIRVFSSESGLRIRWPKYWSFSFNISFQ